MKLHFKKVGDGKPFIILHGLFGSGDNLQSFAKSISAHGFAVYLVDLRNHGHSPHAEEHNYQGMSEDVFELIGNEKLEKPIVFGHSMGGKVAMQMAIEQSHNISKLIVVDITPFSYPPHHQKIIEALQSVDLDKIQSRGEAEKILSEKIDNLAERQFLLKNLFWKESNKLAWRFNLNVLAKNIEEVGASTESELPAEIPVLFVKGERSNYIDPSKFDLIKKTFPNAQLIEITKSGHWVHADNPGKLLNYVLKFATT